MNKIKIIVDSTCDLGKEDIEANHIEVMPLSVVFGKETYKDTVDIDTQRLFAIASERGELPKTSAVNAGEFEEVFKKYVAEGYQIICFTISSLLSSTCQNAHIAAQQVDENNIKVVDSLNLSTGIGLLVLKAARFIKEGCTLEEVYDKVCALREKVRSQFVIETFDYLYKGGRCNSLIRVVGTLLKIRPVIVVRDGKMDNDKKPIGKPIKGWQAVLDYLKNDIAAGRNIDLDNIFVTHTGTAEGEAYLVEQVKALLPDANVKVTNAGSVIGSHCGPNTIGVLYIVD